VESQRDSEQLDQLIGNLLLIGVIVSGAVAAIGGAFYLVDYAFTPADYHVFHGEPAALKSVGGIVSAALSMNSQGIIQLGLLLLIATPVARVVLSIVAFALQRDLLYVGITLIVLAVLAFSLLSGGV